MNETLRCINGNPPTVPLNTNGSLHGVNGETSRVIFREPEPGSKPESASPSSLGNGRKLPSYQTEPLIPPNAQAAQCPPVVDEQLEDQDLRLTFTVSVHGRSRKIVGAKFDRVIPDGIRSENRHVFFAILQSLLDEMRQTIAIRTNSKIPVEPFPKDGGKNWDGKDFIARDPGTMPASLKVHDDPLIG
jgi:hypothetical protein